MKPVKDLRKKAPRRKPITAPVYSTSEARANFAEAIETAQLDSAVIGFDRYGRTVAALVPIEAIYMLAGREDAIAPEVRNKIERGARSFVQHNVPNRIGARTEPQMKLVKPKPRAKRKRP
jgi:hypothetical protein